MALEVLAPVGGEEQLIAAVRAGADAVYLGTKSFNARRNASNFDGEALKKAVAYCHGRGVKVHVTCNTLVMDSELESLYEEIKTIAASGADAVIVQDLGAAAIFREYCPEMPLHASTQLTIHNSEGVLEAERLGFSRVVLSREVSLEEIRDIRRKTKAELEIFVHGALCMSVSGQCWLSSMLGGRSGNRGLCAQPCRLNFRAGGREYALSLKDLSALEYIQDIENAGVCSLKIEGRMKRPEYVAAATAACRAAADGEIPNMERLRAVFSRSGFTDGYLTGKRGIEMFGIRTKEDVKASSEVLSSISSEFRHERQSIPVCMKCSLSSDKPAFLEVSDGEITVSSEAAVPQKARSRGADAESIRKSIEKTGGTPFYLETLEADIEEGLYVSPAELNALRREALDKLLEERSKLIPKPCKEGFTSERNEKKKTKPTLRLRFETAKQLFASAGEAEYIYLPYGEISSELINRFGDKLIAELPRFVPQGDIDKIAERLQTLKEAGLKNACAGTLGDISLIRRCGMKPFGGFSLNVLNSRSASELERLGLEDTVLSFETAMSAAERLSGIKTGLLAYGYLPLMLFRCCPMKSRKGCGSCSGREKLIDRTGTEFTVLCSEKKYSVLLNSLPLYIGDKSHTSADFEVLYYTVEAKDRCEAVYKMFTAGEQFDFERTNGLYYRALL